MTQKYSFNYWLVIATESKKYSNIIHDGIVEDYKLTMYMQIAK